MTRGTPTAMSDRFVGRAQELNHVLEACGATRRGRGALVVVSGASGIGKTRFCQELVDRLGPSDPVAVMARCWVDGGAPPLWPWQPILTKLCDRESAELLSAEAGSAAMDPERFVRFSAVTDRLAEACRETATCLVIDDIQAADVGTLLLIRFVARSLEDLPLALVVARRTGDGSPDRAEATVLDEIDREALPVVLRPFDLDETTAFLAAQGLDDLDPAFVDVLQRTTGGNPLFLRRIAALGPPDPTEALPGGLRAAIEQALAQLPTEAQGILRSSAVLGTTVSVSEAARLIESEPATVLDALERAAAARLVTALPPAHFEFSHQLVRATLEESLGTTNRLDLHALASSWAAGGPTVTATDRLVRRAHHALSAAPRSAEDARHAVWACREAARSLVRSFAYEQADALLSAAVGLHDSPGMDQPPAGLLVEWAQAALSCGQLAEARGRFDRAAARAESEDDPAIFAEAALGMGGQWVDERRSPVDRARVLALQRSALVGLGPGDKALRCRLKARLAAEAVYDGEAAETVLAALAETRDCGDRVALAEALSLSHHALLTPEHLNERLALADELVRVASEAGHGLLALMGLCWRTVDLFHLGDEQAPRALEELRERADALACRSILYIVGVLDVMLLVRDGRLDEAEDGAERCYQAGLAAGDADALGYLSAHMLAIRWVQGRASELLGLAEEVADSPTLVQAEFGFRASVADIAAAAGDLDRARQTLDGLRAEGLAALPQSSTWLAGMHEIVEVAAALGDEATAREAYDLLRPFADLPIMPSLAVVCLGSVHRSLGRAARVFGDEDRAVGHLERAVAANRRLGNRPLLAISQADLASVLRQRNRGDDRARAEELTERALHAADRLGMTRRAEQWRVDLDAVGARGRRGIVRREASGWVVAVEEHSAHVPDLLGMRYLAELLTHPGQPIGALDLVAAAGPGQVVVDGSRQELLDEEARTAYAARARELGEDLAEAEANADLGRAEQLRVELDALVDELESGTGLSHRPRVFAGPTERARTAVRKALARAIDQIEAGDHELGEIVRVSVTTGAVCTYTPDESSPVTWSA